MKQRHLLVFIHHKTLNRTPLAIRARRALVKLTDVLGVSEGMLDGISESGRSIPVGPTLGDGISEVGVEETGAVLGAEVGTDEAGGEDNAELEDEPTGSVVRPTATHPLMSPSLPLRRFPEQIWMMLVPSIIKEKLPEPKTPKYVPSATARFLKAEPYVKGPACPLAKVRETKTNKSSTHNIIQIYKRLGLLIATARGFNAKHGQVGHH
jgi:hypothetical protein